MSTHSNACSNAVGNARCATSDFPRIVHSERDGSFPLRAGEQTGRGLSGPFFGNGSNVFVPGFHQTASTPQLPCKGCQLPDFFAQSAHRPSYTAGSLSSSFSEVRTIGPPPGTWFVPGTDRIRDAAQTELESGAGDTLKGFYKENEMSPEFERGPFFFYA